MARAHMAKAYLMLFQHLKQMKHGLPARLKIYGILDKKFIDKIVELKFENIEIKIHRFKPPILNLIPRSLETNPGFLISKKRFVRSLILILSKQPSTLFTKKWISITLIINYNKSEEIYRSLDFKGLFPIEKIYISRSVARFGYEINALNLSHDYDLRRRIDSFELLLGWARLFTANYQIPFKSESHFQKISNTDRLLSEIGFFISQSFFGPIYGKLQNKLAQNIPNRLIINGLPNRINGQSLKNVTENKSWNYKIIPNAKIFHGNLVLANNCFYLLDPNRKSNWGSSMNLIPGIIFQGENKSWSTPAGVKGHFNFPEAILIGGTKNLMHSVLEDLPRLYLSDHLLLPKSVPIIVSDSLSLQIYGLFEKISGRKLVLMGDLTECIVEKLHFFEFDSPLPLVMQGRSDLQSELVSKHITQNLSYLIRKDFSVKNKENLRILILREKGLFRPLINAKKIEKCLVNEFKFTTVYLADKTHLEVLDIFFNAEIVIGEYGAALANCVYMRPTAKLIELRGQNEVNSAEYEILAKSLGIDHKVIHGKNVYLSKFGLAKGPYVINVSRLVKLVETLI